MTPAQREQARKIVSEAKGIHGKVRETIDTLLLKFKAITTLDEKDAEIAASHALVGKLGADVEKLMEHAVAHAQLRRERDEKDAEIERLTRCLADMTKLARKYSDETWDQQREIERLTDIVMTTQSLDTMDILGWKARAEKAEARVKELEGALRAVVGAGPGPSCTIDDACHEECWDYYRGILDNARAVLSEKDGEGP